MMQFFRKLGDTRPAKVLLVILAISFGAWGVGGYLMHQLGSEALSVNGEAVSVGQIQREYEASLKRVQTMLGGKPIPPALLARLDLPTQVLGNAIHRLVILQAARGLNLIPAIAEQRDEIANIPTFKQNGVFNLTRYQQTLASNGMSTSEFERELGRDLSVRLFGQLIQVPSPTVAAVRPLAALVRAKLTLNVLTLSPANLPPAPAITEADLKKFYDANPNLGLVPEKRSFTVLVLDAAEMAKTMTVGDDQVAAEYNTHKADYALPERRHVRHVLVSSEVVAKRLAGEIHNLKDLEKAARDHTLDPATKASGGDLGLIARNEVVPAFADAAFTLKPGQISAPVKSPFGWHIIGVESIEPAHQQPLAEVKDKIETALKRQSAEQTVSDLANQIADAAAAGDGLDKIANQKGLKLQRYTLTDPSAEYPDQTLMQAAFATPEGQVSEPINLPNNAVAYVQTLKVQPASRQPLAAIHDAVLKAARQAQTQAGLANLALSVINQSTQPGKNQLAVAAQAAGIAQPALAPLTVGPGNPAPEWLQPRSGDVMALPVNGILDTPFAVDDGLKIIQVTARQLADPTTEETAGTANAYANQLQAQTEAMLIDKLTRESRVSTNRARLQAIFGPSATLVVQ